MLKVHGRVALVMYARLLLGMCRDCLCPEQVACNLVGNSVLGVYAPGRHQLQYQVAQ